MKLDMPRSAQAVLLALALGGTSSLALAQAQGGQPPAGQAPQQSAPMQAAADVSDAELEMFASAYSATMEIRQDFTQQLNNAESTEEVQELQQQANEEMIQAVEDNGLSVEEYNTIAQAVSNDPELQSRLSSYISQ